MRYLQPLFIAFIMFSFITNVYSQAGSIDYSFGNNGISILSVGEGSSAEDMVIQNDGKIVVVGQKYDGSPSDFLLARYTLSGALDNSFGVGGIVFTDFYGSWDFGNSVDLQNDGKLIVTGVVNNGSRIGIGVARYNIDGSLDASFGTGGKEFIIIGSVFDAGRAIKVQSDGKIIIAGNTGSQNGESDFVVIRLNSNGGLDNTFNNTGVLIASMGSEYEQISDLKIQSDGKIIVSGSIFNNPQAISLFRINPNGSIDFSLTYDDGGYENAGGLVIQPDGKILLIGTSSVDFLLLRYNVDGSLDPSFGINGKVLTNFANDYGLAVGIQPDGKILVAGYSNRWNDQIFLTRYDASGNLDNTFNGNGLVLSSIGNHSRATALALHGDRIFLAGSSDATALLVSYVSNPSASCVTTTWYRDIDHDGFGTSWDPVQACTQPFGYIVTGGDCNDDDNSVYPGASEACDYIDNNCNGQIDEGLVFQTYYYDADGDGFGDPAQPWETCTQVTGFVLNSSDCNDSDPNIYPGAYTNLTPSVPLVPSFGNQGGVLQPTGTNYDFMASALQADGKLIAFGTTLARFITNGSLDASFGTNGMVDTDIRTVTDKSVAIQPDGKILVCGEATISGLHSIIVKRYMVDGTIDAVFGTNGSFSMNANGGRPEGIAVQADGKIVVAGMSSGRPLLFRITTNGSLDPGFNGAGIISLNYGSSFNSVEIQPDGKIVAIGSMAYQSPLIVRYNTDGSIDNSFTMAPGIFVAGLTSSGALQPDGKILLLSQDESDSYYTLSRFNSDGSVDASFNTIFSDINTAGNALALQPDGRILVGGFQGEEYLLARYKANGTTDQTFGANGSSKVKAECSYGGTKALSISTNRIYATGSAGSEPEGTVIAYQYNWELTCPANQQINSGGATTVVNNIDPRVQPFSLVNYTLSGATTGNGNGSASGHAFNLGTTTVNYTSVDDPSKTCSFDVVVIDLTAPVITDGPTISNLTCNSVTVTWTTDEASDSRLVLNNGPQVFSTSSPDFVTQHSLTISGLSPGVTYTYRVGSMDPSSNGPTLSAVYSVTLSNSITYYEDADGDGFGNSSQPLQGCSILPGHVAIGGDCDDTNPNIYPGVFTNLTSSVALVSTFGNQGGVLQPTGTNFDFIASALQPDGKLIAFGTTLARFNTDGSLDASFGINGMVATEIRTVTDKSVAIQPDGKIIVCGESIVSGQQSIVVKRFMPDGTPDQAFGTNGSYIMYVNSGRPEGIAIQPDGKIVVAGVSNSKPLLFRLTTIGSLDAGFNGTGIISLTYGSSFNAVEIQPDGKIVAIGSLSYYNSLIIRYNPDGSVDNSFTMAPGVFAAGLTSAGALQPDGKILVLSQNEDDFFYTLSRFKSDGSVDASFTAVQSDINTAGNALAIQPDGRILVGGYQGEEYLLARYNANGTTDQTFGANGISKVKAECSYGGTKALSITPSRIYATGAAGHGSVLAYQYNWEVSCPVNQQKSSDQGVCTAVVNNIDPSVQPFTLVNYTLTGATTGSGNGSASGLSFNPGVTTVTYADINNSSRTCSFTVTVVDTQAPVITCPASLTVNTDPNVCGATVTYVTPVATDNCSETNNVLIVASEFLPQRLVDVQAKLISTGQFNTVDIFNSGLGTPTLALLQAYKSILVFTGSSSPENSVLLGDNLAAYIDGGGAVVDAVFDNASNPILGAYNSDTYRVMLAGGGHTSQTVLTLGTVLLPAHPIMTGVTSFNGGTASWRAIYNWLATGAYPIALYSNDDKFIMAKENVGPMNARRVSLNMYPPSKDASIDCWLPTTDGARIMANALNWASRSTPVTVTQTSGLSSGSVFPVGVTTNTFVASDASGNTSSCSFTVTVVDNQPTVITCPANIITNVNGLVLLANYPLVTNLTDATSNFGPVSLAGNPTPPTAPTAGTPLCQNGIYMAYANGQNIQTPNIGTLNTSDFELLIDFKLNTSTLAPVIMGGVSNRWIGIYTNAAGNAGVKWNNDFTAFSTTTLNVNQWYSARLSLSSNTIRLYIDNELVLTTTTNGPLNTGGDLSFTTNDFSSGAVFNGCIRNLKLYSGTTTACSAIVHYTSPTGTDNCPGAITVQTAGLASGTAFPVGITTNTFETTDADGNTTSCSFTVTVVDNEPPTINCQANISVVATSASGAVVNYTAPVGTDNCSSTTTRTAGLASGSIFPIGTTIVTHRVTDASNLTAECSFTVTVEGVAPQIVCPGNITVNSTAGQCNAIVNFSATESTGIPASTITYSQNPGTSFPVGSTTVTATATNAVGTSTCSFTVIVVDNQLPVIPQTPPDVIVYTDPGFCTASNVILGGLNATDNCQIIAEIDNAPSVYPIGVTIVTRTVFDAAGNGATVYQNVIVIDNEAPVFTCPSNMDVTLLSNCQFIVPNLVSSLTGTDNCTGVTFTQSPAANTLLDGQHNSTYNIIITASDGNGNSSSCTVLLTAKDISAPIVEICPADRILYLDANCQFVVPDITAGLTGTDNCGTVSFTQSPAAGTLISAVHNQSLNFHVTASDGNGNLVFCTILVTAKDVTPPVITSCPPNIVSCWVPSGTYTVAPLTATDNCSTPVISYTITGATTRSGTGNNASGFFAPGTSTIAWTVSDGNGNFSYCTTTVMVDKIDGTIPDVFASGVTSAIGQPNTIYVGYSGTSITLSANVQSSINNNSFSYKWTIGGPSGPPLATTPTFTVSPVSTTTYCLTVKNNMCNIQYLIFKQVTVTDIRCGNNKINVCVLRSNGTYITRCVSTSNLNLSPGSYLGECNQSTLISKGDPQVENEIDELNVSVFPNPSNSYFNLRVNTNDKTTPVSLRVLNLNGQPVDHVQKVVTGKDLMIGETLKTGYYLVEIIQGNQRRVVKLVKL